MKGKARRTQLGFGNMGAYGKADRAMQKSRRKETIHFNNNDKAWLSLVSISFISGMMKGFKGLLKFLFNNTSSVIEDPVTAFMPHFSPIGDELLKSNPNRRKGWYKTHVPKSMRKGLNSTEILAIRKKIYFSKEIYV